MSDVQKAEDAAKGVFAKITGWISRHPGITAAVVITVGVLLVLKFVFKVVF